MTLTPRYTGEVLSATAQRLIKWGLAEAQAYALAQFIKLPWNAPDAAVEHSVVKALVSIRESVDGEASVEYVGGQRRDTLRLESR